MYIYIQPQVNLSASAIVTQLFLATNDSLKLISSKKRPAKNLWSAEAWHRGSQGRVLARDRSTAFSQSIVGG